MFSIRYWWDENCCSDCKKWWNWVMLVNLYVVWKCGRGNVLSVSEIVCWLCRVVWLCGSCFNRYY